MTYENEVRWARTWMNLHREHMRRWARLVRTQRTTFWKIDALKQARRDRDLMCREAEKLTKLLYPNGLPHKQGQLELF